MPVADVIAMHVADEDGVDLAEPRVVGSGDRAPGVIENSSAVRILKDHRPVELAELALLAAQRRHLDIGSERGQG